MSTKFLSQWIRFTLLVFLTTCYLLLATYLPTFAQTPPIGISIQYPVVNNIAQNGDIVFYSPEGLVQANVSYSNKIFGVLQDTPLMVYKTADNTGKPVIDAGIAEVNVTNANGPINAGDYVTSSSTPGKGQKATISGYVIGTALENLEVNEGQIRVNVRIEYVELTNTRSVLRLLDAFNIAAFQNAGDPDKASQLVQYLSAAMVVLICFAISFLIFARSITKSIEALGRNPLAKTAIQISIVIQGILTIAIILLGMGAAYIIVRL